MSLPRYVINFDELVDGLFESNKDNIKINKGKQYSKGFYFNYSQNSIEWVCNKDIIINNIVLATTTNTDFGIVNLDIYIESKLGRKNYIFDSVYIKDIYEIKNILSPPVLNISEKLKIEVNNLKNIDDVFIDVDFLEIEKS